MPATMKITIKLFASLKEGRFDIETREYREGTAVVRVRRDLKIPQKDAAIIFVNGVHAEPDTRLRDGDTLAFFPPVGGG